MTSSICNNYVLGPGETKSLFDKDGVLHTDDHRPSLIKTNGDQLWHKHGKLHNENGPAVARMDGTKKWYLDNRLHRIELVDGQPGPAVIYSTGAVEHHIAGHQVHADVVWFVLQS